MLMSKTDKINGRRPTAAARRPITRAFLRLAFVLFFCCTRPVQPATIDLGHGFADHGVATPCSEHRGVVATVDGQGHPLVLAWLRDYRGCYELLLCDLETRTSQEIPLPFRVGDDPFASILSSRNRFYTHFNSHFVEFDPVRRAFTFCHKTAPQMAMSMTEDDRGVIWSATYPQSGVVSFDPKTRDFRDYGHVYKQDWEEYPRSVAVDDAGWVYLGIGSAAAQIVALDPKTGKATPLIPEADREHGYATVFPGADGNVYGQPRPSRPHDWLVLHAGRRTGATKRPPAAKPLITGSQGLFHRTFPDGKQIRVFNLIDRLLVVDNPKTKTSTTLHFAYKSEGALVMAVAAAPDDTICGGTTFPSRFFRYDPRNDQWTRHAALGQWNTVARQGDRFFAGIYGGGGLLEWNPLAPWVDTRPAQKDSNPLFLTKAEPTINRPHKLLACPDGRTLVLAGTPGYGLTGGGLLFWDRPTSKQVLLTHEQLIPQQSTMSLVALPGGKLLGGTTIAAGTGGQIKAQEAELYLLDLATKRIEWHAVVIPGVHAYNDLYLGSGGLVWGFADGRRFFVFDPAAKKLVHNELIPAKFGVVVQPQGPRVFVEGSNHTVYVLFYRCVGRIEPKSWKVTLVAKSLVTVTAGGDFLDGRIYFVAGSHLYSFKPPER